MPVTFVGLTRFSLVTQDSLSWFQSTRHLSLEEAKKLVFDRDRLMLRLKMFSRFALPTYAALTRRPDSYGLVLINADLPAFCRKRLREMVAPYPNIRLVPVRNGVSFKWPPKKASMELAQGGRLFSYRLDDDDALSPAYVDIVRERVEALPDLTAVSVVDGWTVAPLADERYEMQRCEIQHLALGLGVLSSAEDYRTAFTLGNHMTIHKRYESHFISSERPLWLRTRHAYNDTQKRRRGPDPEQMPLLQASATLRKDFPFITLAALRALTPPPPQPAEAGETDAAVEAEAEAGA